MEIMNVVFFLIPGFLYNYLHQAIWSKKKSNHEIEGYTVLARLVLSSLIINLAIMALINLFPKCFKPVSGIHCIIAMNFSLGEIAAYLVVSFILAFIGALLMGILWSKLEKFFVNKIREKNRLTAKSDFSTVYEAIFESNYLNPKENRYPIIKIIHPDGKELVGFLRDWSDSSSEEQKIILWYSQKIRDYIDREKYPLEEYIEAEMFDYETAIHTKLYYGRDLAEKLELIEAQSTS